MADAQIAIIDGDQTQVVLAPGENPAIVTSIPGPQGPAGAGVPLGGTTNQVLFKQSGTNYDTAWGPITSAMIGDLEIVNADVSASAAIAGTKISPNFGSQNVTTTGTSTAASFIPTSSTAPTNGLYLSAANSVALSANGQGRVFIDANGRVGINKSSLSRTFEIQDADARTSLTSTTGTNGVFHIITNTGGNLHIGRDDSTGGIYGQGAYASHIRSAGAYPLVLSTNSSPALTIDSSQRVGIGTSSPGSLLSLSSSNSTVYTSTGAAASPTSGSFCGVANTDTTTGASSFQSFTVGGAAGTSVIYHGAVGGGGSSTGQYVIGRRTGTSSYAESLRIDSSGRVGIGTTSPGELLDISPSTEAGAILLGRIPYATHGSFLVGNGLLANHVTKAGNSTVNVSSCKIDFGNGPIIFSTSPGAAAGVARTYTETARIDSSGRLLVGTSTAPSYFTGSPGFSVNGTGNDSFIAAARYNSANAFGSDIAFLRSRSGTVGTQTIVQSGDALGALSYLGSDGTSFIPGARIIGEVDGTPGANTMPGRLVFSTTSSTPGASPTERMRIKANGTINFSNVAVYADNAAATTGGLAVGDVYRTSTGQLMIRY